MSVGSDCEREVIIMSAERWRKEMRERVCRLRDLGARLEIPEDYEDPNFIIRQTGALVDTRAFDLSCGGTGFAVSLRLTTNKYNLAISYFGIEVDWEDATVRWLDDPNVAALRNVYQFPGSGPEFPRNAVINHVANFERRRSKGYSVEGLLLGIGSKPIPSGYRQNDMSPALVTVVDQFDVPCLCPVDLWIDRSAKSSTSVRKKPRRKLCEQSDLDSSTRLVNELESERAKYVITRRS
jgi:hypothetical protein